jgi:hypothetical protein
MVGSSETVLLLLWPKNVVLPAKTPIARATLTLVIALVNQQVTCLQSSGAKSEKAIEGKKSMIQFVSDIPKTLAKFDELCAQSMKEHHHFKVRDGSFMRFQNAQEVPYLPSPALSCVFQNRQRYLIKMGAPMLLAQQQPEFAATPTKWRGFLSTKAKALSTAARVLFPAKYKDAGQKLFDLVLARALSSLKAQVTTPGAAAAFPPADQICPAPKPVGGVLTIDNVPAVVLEKRHQENKLAVRVSKAGAVWVNQAAAEAFLKTIVDWATQ